MPTNNAIDRVLSAFPDARESSGGWSARCPAHDDRRASLSISTGNDGRVLLHCHAGCETSAIVGKLGLTMKDLMPSSNGSGVAKKGKSKLIATYNYHDADGRLLYQVCRFDPKEFRQRAPKPGGGWSWSVKGVKKFPYHMNWIAKADLSKPIFVVEGEKDADRLLRIGAGIIATCNAGGAGKWQKDFAKYFAGRSVVILPHNDKPGRDHAQDVAAKLHGTAVSIKIIELPGLPDKGDVSDWLDAGHAISELQTLVDAAPIWEPSAEDEHAADKKGQIIANALRLDEETVRPIRMAEIIESVMQCTDGTLRRVGKNLFVFNKGDAGVFWLESPAALFGWLQSKCGVIDWRRGNGFATKEESFCELQRLAPSFAAVSSLPHWPPLPSHFYLYEMPMPGEGKHLDALIDLHCLESDIDRELALAFYATGLWGGPPGTRPAFLVTASTGRGKGKTKFVQNYARTFGGCDDISPQEDIGVIKQRLLSPDAAQKRIASIDNLKTHRFSWGEFEALVTTDTISGKQMYVGNASRPNLLTWTITLNGAGLSTDVAQRVVEIRLREPNFNAGWEEKVNVFIDEHRQQIIADVIGFLQRPAKPLKCLTRWATWESQVLSKVDHPDNCITAILERRAAADVEQEEGTIIEDYFAHKLNWLGYDIERDDIFIPNDVVANWYNAATGDKRKVAGVTRTLKQLKDESQIMRIIQCRNSDRTARGFRWVGDHADASDITHYDIRARLASKLEERQVHAGGEQSRQ